MIHFHRILVPTDFSVYSHDAVRHAVAVAEKFGSELHLLHVVPEPVIMLPDMVTATPPVGPSVEELIAAGKESLAKTVTEEELGRLKVTIEAVVGEAAREIVRYAAEKACDLVVMGTHGRTGLRHLLMGSVAERVLRKAPCPVLTMKHPDHAGSE